MQINKIIKRLKRNLFNNLNLTLIFKYLSGKNINKIKNLLIKLLYNKINLRIKMLNI